MADIRFIHTSLSVEEIAAAYFSMVSAHFPTMTSCDEFISLPRTPGGYELETFDNDEMLQTIRKAKELLGVLQQNARFQQHNRSPSPLRQRVDTAHLARSLHSFINEFELLNTWRHDPTLYLKVINLALERVYASHTLTRETRLEALRKIVHSIPNLLKNAVLNLNDISEACREAAVNMKLSSSAMIGKVMTRFLSDNGIESRRLSQLQEKAMTALDNFLSYLTRLSTSRTHTSVGGESLDRLLRYSFGCETSSEDIYAWACEERPRLIETLERCADDIAGRKPWREVYEHITPTAGDAASILLLFEQTVSALQDAFGPRGDNGEYGPATLLIQRTPSYLKPIRAHAAYRAPDPAEPGYAGIFFVPTVETATGLTLAGREHLFLAAHETYPGHHLLDYHRVRHPEPIRSYIEAPLFYEGWACYAENLVAEHERFRTPLNRLVLFKRRLWRVNRLLLEHDVQKGTLSLEQAAGRIMEMGYDRCQAHLLARRYTLNPGYQTTYAWGLNRILTLRNTAGCTRTGGMFEQILLTEGQIPFDFFTEIMVLKQ